MRVLLVLLFAAVAQCRLAPLHRVTPNIPGQYIVELEDDVNVGDFAANMKSGTVRNTISGILNAVVLKLDDDLLDQVRSLKGVKMIEEDGLATILDNRDASQYWGLDRIDQRDTSYDDQINIIGNGDGTNVYVIDTGIRYTHNEFAGLRTRAEFFFDYAGGDGSDCHGHGTHCAGTVGGKNSGVASATNLFSVRVMSCTGSGSYSDIINGLDAVAADSRTNKVASMSIGGGVSDLLTNAVARAHAAGVVVVVAAGNDNRNACNYSPASAPDAITVGATTKALISNEDQRSSFSNYGSCLDIFAPGSSIRSAGYGGDSRYTTMSGTSMACPHVAGAAAILLGNNVAHDQVAGQLENDATSGVISNPGTGSPNLLLYLN